MAHNFTIITDIANDNDNTKIEMVINAHNIVYTFLIFPISLSGSMFSHSFIIISLVVTCASMKLVIHFLTVNPDCQLLHAFLCLLHQ